MFGEKHLSSALPGRIIDTDTALLGHSSTLGEELGMSEVC